jgi:uncharacterized membrane protein
MVDTVFGLPLHPLVVHATVVVLPIAAITVAVAAVWPRFRRIAGPAPLLLSVISLMLVPVAVASGRSLADRVERTGLLGTHEELGEGLLPWVVVLTVGAAGLYWWSRRERRDGQPDRSRLSRAVAAAVALVALVGATGTAVQVVRVGHSGTEAVWSDVALVPHEPARAVSDRL